MIYTKLTIKAMNLAYKAHLEQVDKAGLPYIFHPYHLAEKMDDEISTCVALLHDVIEDTPITLDDLKKEFPNEVIEALSYLTHDVDVNYFDYVNKIKENPIAIKVKLADIEHNSDQSRFVGVDVDTKKLEYLKNKYKKAKQILLKENIN